MVKREQGMYIKKDDFLRVVKDWGESKRLDDIPWDTGELSKKLKICGVATDLKAPADDGYRAPAYKFPYQWREDSEWKIEPVKYIKTDL